MMDNNTDALFPELTSIAQIREAIYGVSEFVEHPKKDYIVFDYKVRIRDGSLGSLDMWTLFQTQISLLVSLFPYF